MATSCSSDSTEPAPAASTQENESTTNAGESDETLASGERYASNKKFRLNGVELAAIDPTGLATAVNLRPVPDEDTGAIPQTQFDNNGFVVIEGWNDHDFALIYRDVFCGLAPTVALAETDDGSGITVDVTQAEAEDCDAAEFFGEISVDLDVGLQGRSINAQFTPH